MHLDRVRDAGRTRLGSTYEWTRRSGRVALDDSPRRGGDDSRAKRDSEVALVPVARTQIRGAGALHPHELREVPLVDVHDAHLPQLLPDDAAHERVLALQSRDAALRSTESLEELAECRNLRETEGVASSTPRMIHAGGSRRDGPGGTKSERPRGVAANPSRARALPTDEGSTLGPRVRAPPRAPLGAPSDRRTSRSPRGAERASHPRR